eukprot:756809-Hanusia_phi.AAC.6
MANITLSVSVVCWFSVKVDRLPVAASWTLPMRVDREEEEGEAGGGVSCEEGEEEREIVGRVRPADAGHREAREERGAGGGSD